jgi:hypothetical protein
MSAFGHLHMLKEMPYDVVLTVVEDKDTVLCFMKWFEENVSSSFAMSNRTATIALKSILVVSHCEQVVEKGILMHVVFSTALDLVTRLDKWDSCPHAVGMCSAIDMFVSTWENHQRSLRPYDLMASVIQTRFWFSHARWVVNHRLLQFFRSKGFTMQNFLTMSICGREELFREKNFESYFKIWIKKLYVAVAKQTGERSLEYNPGVSYLQSIKMSLFVQIQLSETGYSTDGPLVTNVLDQARYLNPLVDSCLSGDYSNAKQMLEGLLNFGQAFGTWWQNNKERMCAMLQHHIYSFSHSHSAGKEYPITESGIVGELKKRYSYMTSYDDMNGFVQNSSVMRALNEAERSAMWKNCFSSAEVMHELLINPSFLFKTDQCYPVITNRYTGSLPTSVGSENFESMLIDIMAGAMFSCKSGMDALQCVEVFNMDGVRRDVGCVRDAFPAYAGRVFNYLLSRIGSEERKTELSGEWDADNFASSMLVLFKTAKEIRVQAANTLVNTLRAIDVRYRLDFVSSSQTIYDKTRRWIQKELSVLKRRELELVRSGDPFVLLRFHDQALVNLVCDQGYSTESLPEVLELDVHRLNEVRVCISLVSDTFTMRYVLCELVTSNQVPRSVSYVPSKAMFDAADILRAVMTVCRIVHGEMTMRLTRELATTATCAD